MKRADTVSASAPIIFRSIAGLKRWKETYVHVRANGVQRDIRVTGDVKGDVLPELTEVWNLSEQRGTQSSKGYNANEIRNFCYKEGKLYCVYQNKRIIVLNAQTGGPTMNVKGSAAGGGNALLIPMTEFSLGLTGDINDIMNAHNLAMTALNARMQHERNYDDEKLAQRGLRRLDIDPERVQYSYRVGTCQVVARKEPGNKNVCF